MFKKKLSGWGKKGGHPKLKKDNLYATRHAQLVRNKK